MRTCHSEIRCSNEATFDMVTKAMATVRDWRISDIYKDDTSYGIVVEHLLDADAYTSAELCCWKACGLTEY